MNNAFERHEVMPFSERKLTMKNGAATSQIAEIYERANTELTEGKAPLRTKL